MTATATPPARLSKEQRACRASEALRADILVRIRKIAKEWSVTSDATGEPEWVALTSLERLDSALDVTVVRDVLAAAILRGLQHGPRDWPPYPTIRVTYARILALLNNYLWVAQHPASPDHWPCRADLGEW